MIETSIRAPRRTQRAQFGWLDEWTLETDRETGASRGLSLTLSNWVYEGLIADRALLTLHPDYFSLAGGLERAIYRIARKHAGDQTEGWICRLSVLHQKTGSESPLKQFSYLLKRMVTTNNLPDYNVNLTVARDGAPALHFVRRDAQEKAEVRAGLEALAAANRRRAEEDARAAQIDRRFARDSVADPGEE